MATIDFELHMDIDEIVERLKAEGWEPVKHGRWIYNEGETIEDGGYCSVCECDQPMFIEDWEWKYIETDYCPHCGAKMDEEVQNNEEPAGT